MERDMDRAVDRDVELARLTDMRIRLEQMITLQRIKHVVVSDRHGSKLWEVIRPSNFGWGRNAWLSTAVADMRPAEVLSRFGCGPVLLFADNAVAIPEMEALSSKLSEQQVDNRRCVPESSPGQQAPIADPPTGSQSVQEWFTEDLWSHLAAPRDADHLTLPAAVSLPGHQLLAAMAKWGIAFPVSDGEHNLTAFTIDRPQFFNTAAAAGPWHERGFTIDWSGPCKLRLYIGTGGKGSNCAFVAYPEVGAPLSVWTNAMPTEAGLQDLGHSDFARVYRSLCLSLSIRLLRDFVSAGAACDLGISLRSDPNSLDKLVSICGHVHIQTLLADLQTAVTSQNSDSLDSAFRPPPLFLRGPAATDNQMLSDCRREILRALASTGQTRPRNPLAAMSYAQLLRSLGSYPEAVISQALDLELDVGTIRPESVREDAKDRTGIQVVRMKRVYCCELESAA
jgi:hypothetical protein